MATQFVELEVGYRIVKVTNPDKIFYSAIGVSWSATSAWFTS